MLRKKSEKCIAFSRPEFALQTRAFQGYVRTSCYLHSFAPLRNWLRQPLQSLPRFVNQILEIEPIYFIAKTKGFMSTLLLHGIEDAKIHSARKHFAALSSDNIKYDVVANYKSLMEIVMK